MRCFALAIAVNGVLCLNAIPQDQPSASDVNPTITRRYTREEAEGFPTKPGGPVYKNPQDGTPMVLIPEGEFLAGDSDDKKGAGRFKVRLPAYYMALHPVTNAQYRRFIDATGGPYGDGPGYISHSWVGNNLPLGNPPDEADHPAVFVSMSEALAYCKWAHLRLPTELEWEKAARGLDGREYPWGNEWHEELCRNAKNKGQSRTCSVWEYPSGCSPWGLYQMTGNVHEWCADDYDPTSYERYKRGDLTAAKGLWALFRGGSWEEAGSLFFACSYRFGMEVEFCRVSDLMSFATVGFRCAMTP